MKEVWRELTPDPFKGALNKLRPGYDAREGSVGRANVLNPKATWAASAGGGLGGALAVLSAKDGYDRISNAADKTRETFGVVGGMAGGYLGGAAGAASGAGLASLPLAVGGSIVGSAVGEGVGYGLYDSYGRLRRNIKHFAP